MKAVLTVAGLGTRLMPVTKELPKEMMPIYQRTEQGTLFLKPVLQVIYESLYKYGIRDFCFVVGRGKRVVEDHFTADEDLVHYLQKMNKNEIANEMRSFFKKLERSNIMFTTQPKPIGFGDAIYRSRKFVGSESFILHAGDDVVLSKQNDHLGRLEKLTHEYNAEAACLIEEVDDPRHYGVVDGNWIDDGVLEIKNLVEKPNRTQPALTMIAIYIFKPSFFDLLHRVRHANKTEMQHIRAFNMILKQKFRFIGVKLNSHEHRIDVGTPNTYLEMLNEYINYIGKQ